MFCVIFVISVGRGGLGGMLTFSSLHSEACSLHSKACSLRSVHCTLRPVRLSLFVSRVKRGDDVKVFRVMSPNAH